MDIYDRPRLKQQAQHRLQEARYDPQKLVLIHSGVGLGVSLLLTVINFMLSKQVDSTGGLAGLGTRSILNTASTILQLASGILLPFWQIGLLKCMTKIVRNEQTGSQDLLEGFRRFGPVLRLMLLRTLLFGGIAALCIYVGMGIFFATPFAQPVAEAMEPLMDSNITNQQILAVSEAVMLEIERAMPWILLICGALYALVAIPLFYRYRMADYIILDQPGVGALEALRGSKRMMYKRRMGMFRLDLSFWWFYLLDVLVAFICYADALVPMLGISMPWDEEVMFFVCFLVYLVLQLALYWWAKAQVECTYAVCYDGFSQGTKKPTEESHKWEYPA